MGSSSTFDHQTALMKIKHVGKNERESSMKRLGASSDVLSMPTEIIDQFDQSYGRLYTAEGSQTQNAPRAHHNIKISRTPHAAFITGVANKAVGQREHPRNFLLS